MLSRVNPCYLRVSCFSTCFFYYHLNPLTGFLNSHIFSDTVIAGSTKPLLYHDSMTI